MCLNSSSSFHSTLFLCLQTNLYSNTFLTLIGITYLHTRAHTPTFLFSSSHSFSALLLAPLSSFKVESNNNEGVYKNNNTPMSVVTVSASLPPAENAFMEHIDRTISIGLGHKIFSPDHNDIKESKLTSDTSEKVLVFNTFRLMILTIVIHVEHFLVIYSKKGESMATRLRNQFYGVNEENEINKTNLHDVYTNLQTNMKPHDKNYKNQKTKETLENNKNTEKGMKMGKRKGKDIDVLGKDMFIGIGVLVINIFAFLRESSNATRPDDELVSCVSALARMISLRACMWGVERGVFYMSFADDIVNMLPIKEGEDGKDGEEDDEDACHVIIHLTANTNICERSVNAVDIAVSVDPSEGWELHSRAVMPSKLSVMLTSIATVHGGAVVLDRNSVVSTRDTAEPFCDKTWGAVGTANMCQAARAGTCARSGDDTDSNVDWADNDVSYYASDSAKQIDWQVRIKVCEDEEEVRTLLPRFPFKFIGYLFKYIMMTMTMAIVVVTMIGNNFKELLVKHGAMTVVDVVAFVVAVTHPSTSNTSRRVSPAEAVCNLSCCSEQDKYTSERAEEGEDESDIEQVLSKTVQFCATSTCVFESSAQADVQIENKKMKKTRLVSVRNIHIGYGPMRSLFSMLSLCLMMLSSYVEAQTACGSGEIMPITDGTGLVTVPDGTASIVDSDSAFNPCLTLKVMVLLLSLSFCYCILLPIVDFFLPGDSASTSTSTSARDSESGSGERKARPCSATETEKRTTPVTIKTDKKRKKAPVAAVTVAEAEAEFPIKKTISATAGKDKKNSVTSSSSRSDSKHRSGEADTNMTVNTNRDSDSDRSNQLLYKRVDGGFYYFVNALLTMMRKSTLLRRAPVLILAALMSRVAVVSADCLVTPDGNGYVSIAAGTNSIADSAFISCSTLKSVYCK